MRVKTFENFEIISEHDWTREQTAPLAKKVELLQEKVDESDVKLEKEIDALTLRIREMNPWEREESREGIKRRALRARIDRRDSEDRQALGAAIQELSLLNSGSWNRRVIVDPRSKRVRRLIEGCKNLSDQDLDDAMKEGGDTCVEVAPGWFIFRAALHFVDDSRVTEDDLVALVTESENRRRLKLEKAHAVRAMVENVDRTPERGSRQPIPQPVRLEVWQRDGGRCVECGSQANLEFDHIIPFSMGGANTARNLQLLCMTCNRSKGATLG